jgi:hypothetical protein
MVFALPLLLLAAPQGLAAAPLLLLAAPQGLAAAPLLVLPLPAEGSPSSPSPAAAVIVLVALLAGCPAVLAGGQAELSRLAPQSAGSLLEKLLRAPSKPH